MEYDGLLAVACQDLDLDNGLLRFRAHWRDLAFGSRSGGAMVTGSRWQTRTVQAVSTRNIYDLLSDGGAGTSETDHVSQDVTTNVPG